MTTSPIRVEVFVSLKTLVKVLFVIATVYVSVSLWPLIVLLFLAAMLAITIYPIFQLMKGRGLPNWASVAILIATIMFGIGVMTMIILPPMAEQTARLIEAAPIVAKRIAHYMPSPLLEAAATGALNDFKMPHASQWTQPLMSAGQVALDGAQQLGLVLIFTIYLITDGPRAMTWLLAFFDAENRRKIRDTADQAAKVASAYVVAQVLTSAICGFYSFIILALLQVPSAVMLAAIAAIFDILPILGFVLAAVPAVLLGMTVSPLTALLIVVLYAIFHAIENYIIVPKIYGSRLRLSDLTVLVAVLAAGSVGGLMGALAILPVVACYPIVERIWLVDFLGRDVVRKHEAATP